MIIFTESALKQNDIGLFSGCNVAMKKIIFEGNDEES